MAEAFSLQAVPEGDVTVLVLAGFLDAHTAPRFEQAIQSEIDRGRVRLVADLSGLSYISSAGLGVFMGFIEELKELGGDLKVCGLIPKVREVFELLGFHALFEIHPDRSAAVESFANAAAG